MTSEDYRAQARDSEDKARTAPTEALRAAYAKLADDWRALAADVQRREAGDKL